MKEEPKDMNCSYCANSFIPTLEAAHNDLFGHTICPKCFATYAHFREKADKGDPSAKKNLSFFSSISRNIGAKRKEQERQEKEEQRRKEEEEQERKDQEAMDQMVAIQKQAKAVKGEHDA